MFATLSPIPGFAAWLRRALADGAWGEFERGELSALDEPDWPEDPEAAERLRLPLLKQCAHYLVREKRDGRPLDSVARFHLGDGARLERINWLADPSPKGPAESLGVLVNYRYDGASIERNHESYRHNGEVAVAAAVKSLLSSPG